MTQEEKAKAYDEALERAKLRYDKEPTDGYVGYANQILEELFPTLAESENERIRKWIIEEFKIHYDFESPSLNPMVEKAMDWLEKQKEQKKEPVEHWQYVGEVDLEKGKEEQKPMTDESFENWLGGWYQEHEEDGEIIMNAAEFKNWSRGIRNMFQQKSNIEVCPHSIKSKSYSEGCGTTVCCTNDESEYDKGYREGHKFGLNQTERYSIGKTFMGLIPCWVNAPSELQPAHRYHGKNVVIMHENNGGFRCVCIDDEKPVTFHLPEDTLFAEGWRKKPADKPSAYTLQSSWGTTNTRSAERSMEDDHIIGFVYDLLNEIEWKDDWAMSKEECLRLLSNYSPQKPAEWSEEDEEMLEYIIGDVNDAKQLYTTQAAKDMADKEIAWLKSLRPQPKQDKGPIAKFVQAVEDAEQHRKGYEEGLRDGRKRHWKPSEEQMKALEKAIIKAHSTDEIPILTELRQQLKKLM